MSDYYVPPQPGNKTKVTQAIARTSWSPPSALVGDVARKFSIGVIPPTAGAGPANPDVRREQLNRGSPIKRKRTVENADRGYRTPTKEGARRRPDRRDTPENVHSRMLKSRIRSASPVRRNQWISLPQVNLGDKPEMPHVAFHTVKGAVDGLGGHNTKPGAGVPLPLCGKRQYLLRGKEEPLRLPWTQKSITLRFEWPGYSSAQDRNWVFDHTQTDGRAITQATIDQLGAFACRIVLDEYDRLCPLHNDILSTHQKYRIMTSSGAVTIPKANVRVTGLWRAPESHERRGDYYITVEYIPPPMPGD